MELKPNPYYRPPNKHDEVPQRLGDVKATPEYLNDQNPEDSTLELRWAFRKLFEKKIKRALVRADASAAKKRQQADTVVSETRKLKKQAKSNSGRGERLEVGHGRDLAAPQVPPPGSEPKLDMAPAVWLRRCEQAGEREDAAGTSGSQEDTAASRPTTEPPESSSEVSHHQPEVSGLPTKEVDGADADSPTGELTERSSLWEGTAPAALPKPIQELRYRETCDELCSATNYEIGQLRGDVGTPKDSLFTYEEAVHHRHGKRGLTVYVGKDIIPVEGDRLTEMSERNLKKLRKQVDEAELSELPRGLLPGGWDALGRPWAPMDCPAERVPQIPSIRGCSRITIAVLVSFPPEPFYFANLSHLDSH